VDKTVENLPAAAERNEAERLSGLPRADLEALRGSEKKGIIDGSKNQKRE